MVATFDLPTSSRCLRKPATSCLQSEFATLPQVDETASSPDRDAIQRQLDHFLGTKISSVSPVAAFERMCWVGKFRNARFTLERVVARW